MLKVIKRLAKYEPDALELFDQVAPAADPTTASRTSEMQLLYGPAADASAVLPARQLAPERMGVVQTA